MPISIAVVSGNRLQDRGIQNFEQLAPLVPNLTITKTPAADLIMLRGIGSSAGSPSLDQSVVMFIDGIYSGNARQFAVPFLDIERLEVLRGPQGALVGRNTSAGAINIITRKPGHEFGGYVQGDYDFTFDGVNIEGAVDVPVGSDVAFRAVGRFADTDGYLQNDMVDQKQPTRREVVGRITGLVESGPVTLTAKYEHAKVDKQGVPVELYSPAHGFLRSYHKSSGLQNGPEYDNVTTDNAVVSVDVDLGGVTLTSISGYSTFKSRSLIDADFYAADFATADFDQDFHQFSQELRLTSPAGGRLEYTAGAYYSTADLSEERTTGVLFAPVASTFRRFKQEDRVFSAFAQATLRLVDNLRLNGSGRWTHQVKNATYLRLGGPDAATERVGALQAEFGGRTAGDRFDPAVSLQYDLTPDAMLYASYGKGSKSAGFQGAISNATEESFAFRPETSTSYEVGAHLTFGNVGFLNLAAFHTIYRDLQVTAAIAVENSLAANFYTGNAPKAKIQGMEAEFLLRAGPVFQVDGSLAWMPTAKYADFDSGPCYAMQPSNGALAGSCDQTGDRLGFTPKLSGSANFTASVPAFSGTMLRAVLSPTFQTGAFVDFTNDPVAWQSSWLKLDARLTLESANERWAVSLIGKNLTNKMTNSYSNTAGLANTFLDPAARTSVLAPPRSIAAQLRIRF